MSFLEESSGSSASESKLVAPNKLRFATKDPAPNKLRFAEQIQPQLREPESSSLESGNASKAEGESCEKQMKEMRKIQFVLCSTWHGKHFSKPDASICFL
jgi:hypothetical protein